MGSPSALPATSRSRSKNWIALTVSNLTITFATFYLLNCLVCYAIKKKRTKHYYKRWKVTNEELCLISTCFVLVRSLVEHVGLIAFTDSMCVAYKVTYTVTYHLSMIPLYLLLWKRQRKLYRQKSIKHLISHCSNLVSSSVFFLYAVFSLASACFYLYMFKIKQSPKGCVHDPVMFHSDLESSPTGSLGKSRLIASVAIFFSIGIPFFQIIFLLLFLNPLMRQYNIKTFCFHIKTYRKTSLAILKVMKRCTLCTFVCVFSDLLLFGCYSLAYNDVISVNTWSLLVNFNGAMHNVVVILSFKHRKRILLPWLRNSKGKENSVRMRNLVNSSSAVYKGAGASHEKQEVIPPTSV